MLRYRIASIWIMANLTGNDRTRCQFEDNYDCDAASQIVHRFSNSGVIHQSVDATQLTALSESLATSEAK
jgi:hypothetical protein